MADSKCLFYVLAMALLFIGPATCIAGDKVAPGPGMVQYIDEEGNDKQPINIYYHVPKSFNRNMLFLFVMHGTERNGEEYRDTWIKWAEEAQVLLIVPEFTEELYPDSRGYQFGNVFNADGSVSPKEKWTYTAIEHIFDYLQKKLGSKRKNYVIYGHSAGAQFVHRMVIFLPEARIHMAIAANAGLYCFPSFDTKYPYGLDSAPLTSEDLKKSFQQKLLILLGEHDIDENHEYLPKTEEAMAQGKHRLERGQNFHKAAVAEADKLGVELRWAIRTVPAVGHSNSGMARALIKLLKGK